MGRIKYKIDDSNLDAWTKNIGKLIVNFSGLEMESHLWLLQLSERPDQIPKNATHPFIQRVTAIKDYVECRHYSKKWKSKALSLWNEASKLAKTRNRLAHNPIMFMWNDEKEEGPPDMIGVIDMQGTKKRIDESPILLSLEDITNSINQVVTIVTTLAELRKE